MAEFPIMPWFPRDYQADTRHLTLEEHGAYRMLLDLLWIGNCKGLPTDDKRLARMLGITSREWAKIKEPVLEFFEEEDGLFFNNRVQKEWVKVSDRVEKNRTNASRGGRARALKNKQTAPANGIANGEPNDSQNVLTHNHRHKHKTLSEGETEADTLPNEAPPETPDEAVEENEGSGGREEPKEDLLHIPAHLRREAKPKPTDLIAAFDRIRKEVWGENMARGWPNQTDHSTAQQWVENGITLDLFEGTIGPAMAAMHADEKPPPELLKFFQRSIAGAIDQAKKPMPQGFPERKGTARAVAGLHADAESNRLEGLVKGYFKDGFWPATEGDNPDEPGCSAPKELIEKYRPKEAEK